ncbi:MAG: SIMPL domain-containing protein [Chloroflexia bacterium]|nr:SIMPL domain-containing protein [Chloroflexia bacterium]
MNARKEYFVIGLLAGALVLGLLFPGRASWPVGGVTAAAEPTPANRFITVTGDAEVRVVPDEVLLSLGVETWDTDLQLALWDNDQRVTEILALLQSYGVESRHIQTEHISIDPRYDDYARKEFIGYFVRKTIVVTLKDVSIFEELFSALMEAGVSNVHGIQFRTTELRKYRDQARALAVNAAREKAEAMAGELGQQVGEPYDIYEEYNGWWSWYGSWWASWGNSMAQNVIVNAGNAPADMEGTMAPGQITVSARVRIRFGLQ